MGRGAATVSPGSAFLALLFHFHMAFQNPIDTRLPTGAAFFEMVDDVRIKPNGCRDLFRRLLRPACAAVLLEYFRSVGCLCHFETLLFCVRLFSFLKNIVTTINNSSQLNCSNELPKSFAGNLPGLRPISAFMFGNAARPSRPGIILLAPERPQSC